MLGRPLWFVPCAPGRGCWRSRLLAPGKPPPCAPWLGRGATAAATWSGWPRRPPRRRNSRDATVHRPTRWPSSPGPSTTMTCPTGRNASAGPRLVIIDEAGMADTLSLDTAVQFIIGRGGGVRLVGDDQQLAAIGRPAVLRDIQPACGAVRLTELHRFTDPAEAAATLALRDGRPEALGFTWTGDASTSATPPPPSTPSSTPGRTTASVSMRSCWLRPGSWSAGSTNAPGTTASPAQPRARRSSWATATGPASAT